MKHALKECNNKYTMTQLEERAVRIFDHLATAVLLFDEKLHLVSINSAGENLLSLRGIGNGTNKFISNTYLHYPSKG